MRTTVIVMWFWAQTLRALWVRDGDAVCTGAFLRKKLFHLHPILTIHGNHRFPSNNSRNSEGFNMSDERLIAEITTISHTSSSPCRRSFCRKTRWQTGTESLRSLSSWDERTGPYTLPYEFLKQQTQFTDDHLFQGSYEWSVMMSDLRLPSRAHGSWGYRSKRWAESGHHSPELSCQCRPCLSARSLVRLCSSRPSTDVCEKMIRQVNVRYLT